MFYLNTSQKSDSGTRYQDSSLVKISTLQKLLKQTQDESQLHKANIRKLLDQHKKLSSLTKKLIQTLESESPSSEKQASLNRQIKLFKRNINF